MDLRYPDITTAERELQITDELNPGLWAKHTRNTGLAARYIADWCYNLDPEKAYVLGLLHDTWQSGRR